MLLLLAACLKSIGQTTFFFDGLQAVADSVDHHLYATVDRELAYITSDRDGLLEWDGDTVTQDTGIPLDYSKHVHTLRHLRDFQDTIAWKVSVTTLPLICLDFDSISEMGVSDSPATLRILSKAHPTENMQDFTTKGLARYRGGSSLSYPKKNFQVTITDSHGEENDTEVMGIRPDSKWILNAMGADLSRMRNMLCFDIWNEMSSLRDSMMLINGIRSYYVEMLINHLYAGIYTISDKVNRKMLGLKKSTIHKKRGLLYKCVGDGGATPRMRLPIDESMYDYPNRYYEWEIKYPNFTPDDECWQPFTDLLTYTSQADTTYQYVVDHLDQYFYTNNVADYLLFIMTLMVKDNCMHNTYLSIADLERDQRFWLTPWDLDASFGRSGWADLTDYWANPIEVMRLTCPFYQLYTTNGNPVIGRVVEQWKKLSKTLFHPDNIKDRIMNYAQQLQSSGAWKREVEIWQDKIITPNDHILRLDSTAFVEAQYMIDWYERNYIHMIESMDFLSDILPTYMPGDPPLNINEAYDIEGRKVPFQSWPNMYIYQGKKYIRRAK